MVRIKSSFLHHAKKKTKRLKITTEAKADIHPLPRALWLFFYKLLQMGH
jgi:hypothetical protein